MPETYCVLTKHNPERDMHNPIQNIQLKEKKIIMVGKEILFAINQAIDGILSLIRCKMILMLP